MSREKTVVITGAGGALAGAIAATFDAQQWQLALFDRGRGVERLRKRHPDALVLAANLIDADEVGAAVQQVLDTHGRIDALLNIAGGFSMQSASQATLQDLDQQLDINLKTLFNTTTAILPSMIEQKEGFILGVSAGPAVSGGARMPSYAASKGAVTSYLKSVAAEVEPLGLGVSILYLMGTADTPANRKAMPNADPSGWISLEQVAETCHFLASRSSRGRVRELMLYASG
ncbi:MAG: SDR family NAD(P)-dependent oxidoreductase [Trueperaceae bacterium]|nr:MAG: SDR family NAD(P)-dependent oxidoreductase [Trueperaceae bacterium]